MTPGGTATVVIELPDLPIPSALADPRHEAIAATVDELDRLGVAHVTILVASGLGRRPSPREIGLLVPPEFRRRFRGRLIVHDAESEDLVELGRSPGSRSASPPRSSRPTSSSPSRRPRPSSTAAPRALVRACSREVLRASRRDLAARDLVLAGLDARGRARAPARRARVPLYGVSLVLNLPHVFGGYPYDGAEPRADRALEAPARRSALLPAGLRGRIIERVPRELTAAAVLGGTPSAAHSEALLRAIEFKGAALAEPLDAIVIGIPPTTPFLPRGAPNPVSAAYLGLGLALRLWRNAFPVMPGGTAILLHDFQRRFPAPVQTPYRALFADPRTARDRDALREAERAALADERAIADYRAGSLAAPARAVRRLERLRRRAQPARPGARRGLPRRARRPPARLRPRAQRRGGARDGPRPRRRADRLPALAALLPPRRRLNRGRRSGRKAAGGQLE